MNNIPMNKPVFKNIGITYHEEDPTSEERFSREEAADSTKEHQHPEDMYHLSSKVELHTSQEAADRAGIRSYVDKPNDPDEWYDDIGYDAPEVYHYHGKEWIHDGHHRIIASRLRGESSIRVHYWQADRYE
jgi:hypothetical protein